MNNASLHQFGSTGKDSQIDPCDRPPIKAFNPGHRDGLDLISPARPLGQLRKWIKGERKWIKDESCWLTLWEAGKYYEEIYKEGPGRLIRNILPEQRRDR